MLAISNQPLINQISKLILIVVAALLIDSFWATQLQTQVAVLTQPASVVGRRIFTSISLPVTVANRAVVHQQNYHELEKKYTTLLAQVAEMEQLQQENQALKKLIESTDRRLSQTIVAAPINGYGDPFVGVGSRQGVVENDMVIVSERLAGIVSEVGETQSRITLLHQANSPKILAQTPSGVQGIVSGNGRSMQLTEVMPDAQLQVGEVITTIGQAGIPRGMVVGVISEVHNDQRQPTQQATIDPIISFYEAVIVEVRKPG